MLPRMLCVLGLSQLVVLAAARRLPRPTQFGDFPRKDALDAQLPPPASRHARSGDPSHDLSVGRPTLSPVELAEDPMCVKGGGGVQGGVGDAILKRKTCMGLLAWKQRVRGASR